jgi:hypothetical protein
MVLAEIERLANKGNLASGAFNIRSTLRDQVIPEFYRDLGDVTWLRKPFVVNVVPAARTYDLPCDFGSMITVGAKECPLPYIGEDPYLVNLAEVQQTASRPRGWYIVPSTEKRWKAIRFDAPSDMSYQVPLLYLAILEFGDDADDLELSEFIPWKYQPALIEALKREIYLDRYGQGDPRYTAAANKYDMIVEQAKSGGHDLAQRNYAIYAD